MQDRQRRPRVVGGQVEASTQLWPRETLSMWRFQFVVVAVTLLTVMVLSAAPVQAQSPVDQASQAGFPLLTEFTLRPGGQPFTYTYTAQTTGPHR